MQRLFPTFTLAAAGLLWGCAALEPAPDRWPKTPEGHFSAAGEYFQVTGVGKPDPKLLTDTQRRSEARDDALRDAWRRLKEYLEALPTREGPLGELAAQRPALRDRIDRVVLGAVPVSVHFDSDGSAAVAIRVRKDALNAAFGTEFR
ncbi:MAG TPA: hypothetical protein DCM05_01080 [Elusimicrobia bacterium]|nr:hypothetical protein [Elusimicrobiota bacterium]